MGWGERRKTTDPTESAGYDRSAVRTSGASYWTSPTTMRIGVRGYDDPRVGRDLAACARCRTPWAFVEAHDTTYRSGHGCSILCEECWSELTPGERLPYYFVWWDRERVVQELNVEPRREPLSEWLEVWPLLRDAVWTHPISGDIGDGAT